MDGIGKPDADIHAEAEASSRKWHETRNAQVAALVADGLAKIRPTTPDDSSREKFNDDQIRWLFGRLYHAPRSTSERMASPDAHLYEGVTHCMNAARNDERSRLVRIVSAGLKTLLGDDFSSLMYELAVQNDINIGHDW